MHLYAPGKHGYQVVRLVIDPQPWLRTHDTCTAVGDLSFQAAQRASRGVFEAISAPARRDILATPEMQKVLGSMPSVTITGALEYQACDDKVCFNPARVPISWTVVVKGLDRERVKRQ